ncbi:MAG: hypothetical protein ACRDTX_25570 [Pseudonocardiaceae bacterium]
MSDLDQIVTESAKKASFQLEIHQEKVESLRRLESGQLGTPTCGLAALAPAPSIQHSLPTFT